MNESSPSRHIWLCADDYGISPGVNRAIRDLIKRGPRPRDREGAPA